MSPRGVMELIPIKPAENYSPEVDRAEYAMHFPEYAPPGRHIEESCYLLDEVLNNSLDCLLLKESPRVPWVSWSTLDVPDKCALLRRAFHLIPCADANSINLLHGYLEVVEYYDRERSRLLRCEFESPGSVSLIEKADLADSLTSAAMGFETGMRSEYPTIPRITI